VTAREVRHNAEKQLCPELTSDQPTWLQLDSIVSMQKAAELSGVSVDTLQRRHPDKIIRLSPRREGMRLCDALMLTEKKTV
jgi:hypothetical protein